MRDFSIAKLDAYVLLADSMLLTPISAPRVQLLA